MRNTLRTIWIVTIIAASIVSTSFAGTYSGGSGTETDPYQIGTVADWQELMADSNDWDANFIMIADINLQGVPLTPVGNDVIQIYFEGVFDGNGHVVRNAAINMPVQWHIGLFGVIDSNSQIRNLGVEDVNMSGERDISGLVGLNKGTITNCYATGKIGFYGLSNVNPAGLVGLNYGTITGCHAVCDVEGTYAGGLVGRNFGTITDSYADGNVSGSYCLGGLVGWNMGTIIDSYTDGEVNSIYGSDNAGGLVGKNDVYVNEDTGTIYSLGNITRCYATGPVNGFSKVGGLVGTCENYYYMPTYITDCYATGSVTGTGKVGGLVGYNFNGSVTDCHATGTVTGTSSFVNDDYVGGLIGSNFRPVTNCYATGVVSVTGRSSSYTGGLMGSNY